MPDIQADLEFLADLPLYASEKPYLCLLEPREGLDPDKDRLDNLEYETHYGITITDMRGRPELSLENAGFQALKHTSCFKDVVGIEDVNAYKRETEQLLLGTLKASYVLCYDLRKRRNMVFNRNQFDINDPLLEEGPAKGVHNGK
jgi:hypothetical protein